MNSTALSVLDDRNRDSSFGEEKASTRHEHGLADDCVLREVEKANGYTHVEYLLGLRHEVVVEEALSS